MRRGRSGSLGLGKLVSDNEIGSRFADGPTEIISDRARFEHPLPPIHDDFGMIQPVVAAILKHARGWDRFAENVSQLLRRGVDEVIDTARTNRFVLSETEKTEKTYLGTKIEILFRAFLKLPKGRLLDLSVDGVEVDIKNTMGSNWAIPEEAHSKLCILIRESEKRAIYSVGIILAELKYLNPGANKDQKRTISALGLQNVWWIVRDASYPPNIWEVLSPETRNEIMQAGAGSKRVAALFEKLQRKPIARATVADVAQQHDALKRVRRNGGARDLLAPKGIAILYGKYDRQLAIDLNLPALRHDEFISYTPQTSFEKDLLRETRHID